MVSQQSTCWDVIVEAANGDVEQREEFVRRYEPMVVKYLGARWKSSPLIAEIADTANEVFLECFRRGGALDRADPTYAGGFRAFLLGVVRNLSRRAEVARGRNRERQASTESDPRDQEICLETSASRVFDRAWARTILEQTGVRHRKAAETKGEEALRRVELLRLRFEDGVPIREIAIRWNVDAKLLHGQYRRARREFRRHLEAELDVQAMSKDERDRHWYEFVSLLQ